MGKSRLPITSYQLPLINYRLLLLLAALVGLLLTAVPLQAQQGEATPVERLTITGASAESLPAIEVRLYGRDAQGNPLDLARETLTIQHGGQPVGPINYQGAHRTGTLTIFLIDIPTGVAGQLPALQEAINQYASPGNMMEQVDYTAVYEITPSQPIELLAPTNFHNSVRNLFAEPLNPVAGATALYDSTLNVLENSANLRPNPDMPIHLVLMTDGTDALSSASGDAVSRRAAELGIPIHTVWLDNSDIGNSEPGQSYLAGLAAATGGVAVQLNNTAELPLIWNRIAGFRDQARIRYQALNLDGGTFPITVALTDRPWVTAESQVTIPYNIPSVLIDLPPESRSISLPNLEDPVRLRLKTQVSWLDGETRTIEAAQLIVNNDTARPFEIPVASLSEFVAEVNNLTYGNNTLEVVVLDSQGMRATSPTVLLTVNEGRRDVPSTLDGGNQFARFLARLFAFLLVLALIGGGLFFLWQRGVFAGLLGKREGGRRRSRRRGGPTTTITDIGQAGPVSQPTAVTGYLDVLESVSRMETPIPLHGTLIRIGRSPAQCEIAFENDITMSRLHANLQREGADYRLFDENSTSGSFVNERQVPEYGIQLVDGDEIHLGAVHLRYRRA
ncbi:MAG TPA: FHA domain-containing protein [Chloroflexota bacterium]|nr:FHA domain-containing protein [Chloroflexota bacterium]